MKKLAVSIGTIDNFKGLEDCLDSILEGTSPELDFSIVVSFNGLEPLPAHNHLKQKYPQILFFHHKNKLGWGRTHNLNFEKIDAHYYLALDDDTFIPKGALEKSVQFMEEHPDCGMMGCKVLNPDGTFQVSFGQMNTLKAEFLNAFNINSFWPDYLYKDLNRPKEVEWLNGCFMLVRKTANDQIHGLDEYYYTYMSEPDWCYRISKRGWKVMFFPDTEIIHVGGQHSNNTNTKKYSQLVRWYVNRFYFFHKHFGFVAVTLLRPIVLLGSLFRLIKFFLVYFLNSERQVEASAKIRGHIWVILICLTPRPYKLPRFLKMHNELALEG